MRAFIRRKRIHGRDYLYEITPYYDAKTKRIRQRSRYLGKDVDGEPVKVRKDPPVRVAEHGAVSALLEVAEGEGILAELEGSIGVQEARVLFAMAANRLTRRMPVDLLPAWYRGTTLPARLGPLPLSRARLSEAMAAASAGAPWRATRRAGRGDEALLVLDDGSPSSEHVFLVRSRLSGRVPLGCERVLRSRLSAGFVASTLSKFGNGAVAIIDEGVSTRPLLQDLAIDGTPFASLLGNGTPGGEWVRSVAHVASTGSVRLLDLRDPRAGTGTHMAVVEDPNRRRKVDAFLGSVHDAFSRLEGRSQPETAPEAYAREALHPMEGFVDWRIVDGKYRAFLVRHAVRHAEWLVGRRILLTNTPSMSSNAQAVARARDDASSLVLGLAPSPADAMDGDCHVVSLALRLLDGFESRLLSAGLDGMTAMTALRKLELVAQVSRKGRPASLSGVDKGDKRLLTAFGLCA